MHKQKGFSLLELMIVLAILSILAVISAPSFRNIVLNNDLATRTNEFKAAISFARLESVKRGRSVILAPETANAWNSGLIVYQETDGTLGFSEGEIIRVWDASPSGLLTVARNSNSTLIFSPDGTLSATTSEVFVLCDERSGANNTARDIQVLNSGIVRANSSSACS
jgi:type IV fimbrial biogenesis protein FimT